MYRLATLNDTYPLNEMFHRYYDEGNMHAMEWDTDKTVNSIYNCVINADSDIIVAEKSGSIVGAAVVERIEPYFSQDSICECRILYVLPAWRGQIGPGLIRQVVKHSKLWNCVYTHIGVTSEIETERTARLYKALGFSHLGYEYRMEN